MKYVDEYRDEALAGRYVEAIGQKVSRPWTLMEICGGQTHTLIKFGIDRHPKHPGILQLDSLLD